MSNKKLEMYEIGDNRPDYAWLSKESREFLARGYLAEGQSAEERIEKIGEHAEKLLNKKGFKDKFVKYMKRGYFSLSSPIWSNFGTSKGLGISCFGSYLEDSIEGILTAHKEVGMMSKHGGGTSGYFGDVRPRGSIISNNGKSDGSFNFAKMFDTVIDVISQGSSRKGQFAGYIDIDHGDIEDWLNIHTEGNPIQLMYYGVCISRRWMREMKKGDAAKRKLWLRLLESRSETGIPYIFFTDNANDGRPEVYKDKNYKIKASNLCSEIMLPSGPTESFVCCLASMNLLYWNEWKNTDAVQILTYLLEAVMTEFIDKSSKINGFERACKFAERHRALGLGALGYHSYLQNEGIPFESKEAFAINDEIFKFIYNEALKASKEMAEIYGEPEMLKGYGRRHTTLIALAPTKSSSFILGQVSQSIEPIKANMTQKDLAKIQVIFKNPLLEKLLIEKGLDTTEVWNSILVHDGSVQHLEGLTKKEKDVFKTFEEINQSVVLQKAAMRQKYIDQGQSLNLMIPTHFTAKQISDLHFEAEELGIKSLYYQYSVNAAQESNRKRMQERAMESKKMDLVSPEAGVDCIACGA